MIKTLQFRGCWVAALQCRAALPHPKSREFAGCHWPWLVRHDLKHSSSLSLHECGNLFLVHHAPLHQRGRKAFDGGTMLLDQLLGAKV